MKKFLRKLVRGKNREAGDWRPKTGIWERNKDLSSSSLRSPVSCLQHLLRKCPVSRLQPPASGICEVNAKDQYSGPLTAA